MHGRCVCLQTFCSNNFAVLTVVTIHKIIFRNLKITVERQQCSKTAKLTLQIKFLKMNKKAN